MGDSIQQQPKLYTEFADWWPLLSSPEDYAEETAFYRKNLVRACEKEPKTLLELGSGGGNNASHLKAYFDMTLIDLSEGMLKVSRKLNPECKHQQGDMRTVRLDKLFDCVFIQDGVDYITTKVDLRQTIETAFIHCKPGGAALFCPDYVRENFRPATETGGHDGEARSMRYMEWSWDPDPNDTTYTADYAYLFRNKNGSVEVAHDRHICGLFERAVWLKLISEAGFEASAIPFEHSEIEPGTHEIFIGKKSVIP